MSIASIGSQMRLQKCKMALCVAPVSVMNNWVADATKWLLKFVKDVQVVMVHGGTKKERNKTIRNAWKNAKPDRPCLIVSSWGLVTSANNESFKTFLPPSGRKWDLVILDEAHQIRVSGHDYVLPLDLGSVDDVFLTFLCHTFPPNEFAESQVQSTKIMQPFVSQTRHTSSVVDWHTFPKQYVSLFSFSCFLTPTILCEHGANHDLF